MTTPHSEPAVDTSSPGDCLTDGDLDAFRAGSLSEAEADALCDHAARCPACEVRLGALPASPFFEAMLGIPLPAMDHIRVETLIRDNDELVLRFLGPPSPEFPHDLGTLGEYRVLEIIGVGGSGIVLKGWDDELDIPVALKVRNDKADKAARDEFRLEARIAGRFKDIPQFVRVLNTKPDHDPPFYAMDYVPWGTLEGKIGRLRTGDVARIARDVATGLAELHRKGWVHQDIKPGNILVPDDARLDKPWIERIYRPIANGGRQNNDIAKILDLGLAFEVRRKTGKPRGCSPGYASPEQLRPNGEIGTASDVFSLGATLFHALMGMPPSTLDEATIRLTLRGNRVPGPLTEICVRCLQKDPARRPRAEKVASELGSYLNRHRRRLRYASVFVSVVMLLGAALLWVQASSLASRLVEIENAQNDLRLRFEADREKRFLLAGQVDSLAHESSALARRRGDPEIARLAGGLRLLVATYEKDAGRPADPRTAIVLRTALATAANAEGRFNEALWTLPFGEVDRLTADADRRTRDAYLANLERAIALEGNGQEAAAVQSYLTAKRLDPSSFEAVLGLTSCLYRLGRKDEAVREWGAEINRLKSLIGAEPKPGPDSRRLVVALLGRGSLSSAMGPSGLETALRDAGEATELITSDRKQGEEGMADWLLVARTMEAAVLIEKGDFRDGLSSAYALLELERWRSYSHPIVPFGALQILLGTIGKVVDRLPADEREVATKILMFATFQRGHLLLEGGDYRRALKDAERVLELEPKVPASILNDESRTHTKARAIRLRMLVEQRIAKEFTGEDEEGARRHDSSALADADRVVGIVEDRLARFGDRRSLGRRDDSRSESPPPADRPGNDTTDRPGSAAPAVDQTRTGDGKAMFEELLGETLRDRGEIHARWGSRGQAITDLNRAVSILEGLVNREGRADMAAVLVSARELRGRVLSAKRP